MFTVTIVPVCFLLIHSGLSQTNESANECLILTPFIKANNASRARLLSEVNSTYFQNVTSYSGYITVKEEYNSNLFFWYFPHEKPAEKPWIIWLQGGPGFSSLYGSFDLIGPIKVEDGQVKLRNITWASDYSLLFIDNPVGAGFSFTGDDRGYPDNEEDVGQQLYAFLLQFLKVFPELVQAPLFIAGQSYAGKYVPALGIQIHRNRHHLDPPINFRGISIGNGLIHPRGMMHYSELCKVMGFVEGKDLDTLRQLEEETVGLIDRGQMVDAANKFNQTIEFIKQRSGVNVYNFNRDPSREAPALEAFVTRKEVRRWLHAGDTPFDFNNQLVYTKMLPDIMNSTKPLVEELLEHYGVMSYSGQLDIILPYSMSKRVYETLQWSRRSEYLKAPRTRLRSLPDGSIAAYKKSGGNFVEILVRRSGHSVPGDVPEVAKFIIDFFINKYK